MYVYDHLYIKPELRSDIEKLNKCRSLSKDDLKGKYAKSFHALIESIKEKVAEVQTGLILSHITPAREPSESEVRDMQAIVNGYQFRFQDALFKERDADKFEGEVNSLYRELTGYVITHMY